jgi:hypothetical protein
MDFRSLLSFPGKIFYLNLFESDRSSATRTPEMNPENTLETDMWARDPTGQSQGEGERRRRPQLAGGEASGQTKVTMRTTSISRTQWHTRGGQRSSEDRPPPSMVKRWRGWSPADHPQPRYGHRKGARAPVSRGK